eukprot:sb/3466627/
MPHPPSCPVNRGARNRSLQVLASLVITQREVSEGLTRGSETNPQINLFKVVLKSSVENNSTFQGYLKNGVKDLPNYRPGMTQEELQIFYLDNLINNCTSYFPRYFLKQMKSLHCKNEGEAVGKYGNTKCEPSKQILTDRCYKLDTTVAKGIRIREISKLGSISNVKNLNVKVIHLLRDPRGTFNSRCHGFPNFYLHDYKEIKVQPITNDKAKLVAQDYCDREVVNLRFTDDHMPGWLNGNYLRLTHSQISLDPLGNAEKVYKFLGLELPQSVRQWAIEQQNLEGEHGGLLSTKKNAQLVLNKWKEELKEEWVQTIQNECKELMLRLNMTLV